jgi:sugar phosphate isomerase/epimerase
MKADRAGGPPAAPGWLLGASTLGAPGAPVDVVVGLAGAAGAGCLELRVGPGEPVHLGLAAIDRTTIRDEVGAAGLTVLSVASYLRVGAAGSDQAAVDDLLAHLRLAADVGAPFLRVFPGAETEIGPSGRRHVVEPTDVVDARMVRRLAAVSEQAQALGVRPVLETHDSHPTGEDVARVLAAVETAAPGSRPGAIWDVLHPFLAGEPVARTVASLGRYLIGGRGYVQVKDVDSTTALTPVPPGRGILPLAEILERLDRGGYRGPISLEWEKAWYPDIAELSGPLAVTRSWLDAHPPLPATVLPVE